VVTFVIATGPHAAWDPLSSIAGYAVVGLVSPGLLTVAAHTLSRHERARGHSR